MLAMWFLTLSAMLVAPETVTLHGAKITGYGETPRMGSGYLMVLRSVRVTSTDGSGRTLYFIHGDRNTFLGDRGSETYPAIGSTCDFATKAQHIASDTLGDGGPDSPIGNVITDIRCDRSSTSN